MRILVTGGSGFIGLWMIRALLAQGAQVRVLDLTAESPLIREILGNTAASVDWRTGDVSDGDAVRAAAEDCDTLVHLAAILTPACQENPVRGAEINLIGSLNVFEAAREHGIASVVYMSSAGVFGPEDGTTPWPTTHYGAFKLAMEGCARAYWADHGIASAGFRPLIVYGPGREIGMTAGPSLACKAAARGEEYVIPFTGVTDFVHVDDVVAAYLAAIETPPEGARAYTLVGDCGTAEDFAAEVCRVVPGARITAEGPTLPIAGRLDPGTLRDDFPSIPRMSIHEGIAATVAYYQQ
jgi:nucleoside-diphosphate-sugar epimerase